MLANPSAKEVERRVRETMDAMERVVQKGLSKQKAIIEANKKKLAKTNYHALVAKEKKLRKDLADVRKRIAAALQQGDHAKVANLRTRESILVGHSSAIRSTIRGIRSTLQWIFINSGDEVLSELKQQVKKYTPAGPKSRPVITGTKPPSWAGVSQAEFESWIDEFIDLVPEMRTTSTARQTLHFDWQNGTRAYFQPLSDTNAVIVLGKEPSADALKQALWHEMGHMWDNRVHLQESVDFLYRRTKGEALESLQKIYPDMSPYERGRPDKFFEAYAGKLYGRHSGKVKSPYASDQTSARPVYIVGTEILSLGIEHLIKNMGVFLPGLSGEPNHGDTDYLRFVLRFLLGGPRQVR